MNDPTDAEQALAARILTARAAGVTLPAPGELGLAADGAYRVQALVTRARVDRGERVAGWKLGYTSAAMREQMGIAEPNLGPLTDAMILVDGAAVTTGVTQPKVEPEVAAVVGAHGAVREWRAALEVVDSVWTGYAFDWALNTADGSSAAFVVVGPAIDPEALPDLPVALARNGVAVASGTVAAAMGHPQHALDWLRGQLSERGLTLEDGHVVITGGLTSAVDLAPGDTVEAVFGEAVSVSVSRS